MQFGGLQVSHVNWLSGLIKKQIQEMVEGNSQFIVIYVVPDDKTIL